MVCILYQGEMEKENSELLTKHSVENYYPLSKTQKWRAEGTGSFRVTFQLMNLSGVFVRATGAGYLQRKKLTG